MQAAVTKYRRLDDVNNGNLLITVQEDGKSRIKVLVDVVSGVGLLSGS